MREQFLKVYNRHNTRSVKWGKMEAVYQLDDARDILPMWIADMDFAIPEVITHALEERLKHPIFGYSYMCEECKLALVDWLKLSHDWTIQTEDLLFQHGVIPAIATILETFTEAGDTVIMTPPVYPPFFNIPTNQNRKVVYSPLHEQNGQYTFAFDHFEQAIVEHDVKMFILCNPHNPAGVVWSREDLQKVLDICRRHDVFVLSDEIHSDLVFSQQHIPIATLATKEDRLVTCVAPTKTFNLAGVQAAAMVVTNPEIRKALQQTAQFHGQMELNAFASSAWIAAYREGRPWLEELKVVLDEHFDYVIDTLTTAVPQLKIRKPESTYLMWLDYRETGFSEKEVMHALLHEGQVALDPGSKYGKEGEGFLRINVATPKPILEDGVARIIKGFLSLS